MTPARLNRRTLLTLLISGLLAMTQGDAMAASDPENTLIMELEDGQVVIELYPDVAPQHVTRLKELAREGFYDGVVFHRVIAGFMAQTGDPTGTGRGGSDKPDLPAEFSQKPFDRGTLGMARSASPNSANSQFFICFTRTRHLDGQYTVVGKVVEGMEYVDQIRKAPSSDRSGMVPNPDKVISMKVAADVQ